MQDYTKPEIISINAGEGPHLVIMGAVHGTERCGPEAIFRAIGYIDEGRIRITGGRVSFVPIANPLAYEQGTRYVERDLNRMMFSKDKPELYEDHLHNVLCPLLDEADALLDLHSYTAKGQAFIFLGPPHPAEADYVRALGVPNFMHGWSDIYKDSADSKAKDPRTGQGTTEYARLNGAKAVTLECGHHHNPDVAEIGFQAIINALEYFGIAEIDQELFEPAKVSQAPERVIRLKEVFYKHAEGTFAKPWENMTPVRKGELLASFNDGRQQVAPEDGFVVMPHEDSPVGDEWLYFGVKSDYFNKLKPS
ncbi:MAG: succinylglutamate desuccinylase/aspartoacylase family protein [Rhodospirillales bacterium]|nr:succinylglutamate desuccinylase/aspartoacylase family protein [Rhodospirillales bacterium]MCB9995948.1 succinylglutamate desuccinylase/aspartoacylase family protein [Rhodospirillales bacterium]